jgi:hypothetical protein
MERANRTCRGTVAAVVLCLLIVVTPPLALGAWRAHQARGRPAATSATTPGCQASASLTVSTRHARQGHAVRFDASKSRVVGGAVSFYDFNYGDGKEDATAQPIVTHAYQSTGVFHARVQVVTTCDTIATSPVQDIRVAYGRAPSARIDAPQPNQTVHFRRGGLDLRGTVHSSVGVRSVELAIQLIALLHGRARAAAAGCYWYDGRRQALRAHSCSTPLFFRVGVGGSRWSFHIGTSARIVAGQYAARVRATDRAGNSTTVFSPRLRNILAFKLVP